MISGTFNFMIVFQAEHNILMHPFHMLGRIRNALSSFQHSFNNLTFLSFYILHYLFYDISNF
jgi:hypothetical protein